ncbi:prepilin-type N-terminal cleavage/methylation domain-containing protein [Halomonas sp. D1-1]|uniref:Prepilin-type N-terminal cleavage/methylation domain-containing protein n=2 Tax=Halomonas icarae TaxID=2691040 RepID=A0A7X4W136_9GAMM|nr:prepilin-type N-terminal cleavage/methylation domain-containing protein [Halomonas icarae]
MMASRGFTLIEALIALLVLSIGLLGVAGMQLKALQGAHIGYQRSVVSLAAVDAQERAWKYLAKSEERYCPGEDTSETTALSTIEKDWKNAWVIGEGVVIPDAGSLLRDTDEDGNALGSCEYQVVVKWVERRAEGDGNFTYSFRLPNMN